MTRGILSMPFSSNTIQLFCHDESCCSSARPFFNTVRTVIPEGIEGIRWEATSLDSLQQDLFIQGLKLQSDVECGRKIPSIAP